MFYMSNKLGAWQVGNDSDKGKVEFKLFFPTGFDPQIASIQVAGDFQSKISSNADWDFISGFHLTQRTAPEGAFWSYQTTKELPADYYQYKYRIVFTDGTCRIVSDPCTRYGGIEGQNAAFVIGGSRPDDNRISPLAGGRKHLRDLTIYELHIDDFTDEYRGKQAPLAAVIEKLDHIRRLGCNAILFMPWTAWKNKAYDWGYEPFHYFAVEYRYAYDMDHPSEKLSWLKKLISACHEKGIHVIMDGVFNHASVDFPYKWMYRDPTVCPYTGEYGGAFPGLQDLNFNNGCTNDFIRDVCLYWMETFQIDGIRFDNTVNFYVPGDPKGLKGLLETLRNHCASTGRQNFSTTLEHIKVDAVGVTEDINATSYWDNAFYERVFQYLWDGRIDSRLLNTLNNQRFLSSPEKVPTVYHSNHDHSYVAWRAGAAENVGSMRWYKIQPYVMALFTGAAVPMIQNGEEFAEDHWIPEDDKGTGRRIRPRPLQWKLANDGIGKTLMKLYTRMANIRLQYPGLRSANFYPQVWDEWQTQFNPQGYGIDVSKQVVIYHRWGTDDRGVLQKFIIALNFSDRPQEVDIPFSEDGVWTDLVSDYSGSWKPEITNGRLRLTMGSNWGHVFFK